MTPEKMPKHGFYVYLIINIKNGKIYVGKSKRMYHRCHQYIYDYRERSIGHINDHLYRAFKKYGIDNFSMIPWEQCRDDIHCTERELFWMDFFRSYNREFGYNLRRDSSTGMITHPETSKKISENIKKQWRNGIRDDHSAKLKANWMTRDRIKAGREFSQRLTKWMYFIKTPNGDIRCSYKTLKVFGLASVISYYHRFNTDKATVKGFTVERVKINV